MSGKRMVPPRVERYGQGMRSGMQRDVPNHVRGGVARGRQLSRLPEEVGRAQGSPASSSDWTDQLIHIVKVATTVGLGLFGLWIALDFLISAIWSVAVLAGLCVALYFLWIKG